MTVYDVSHMLAIMIVYDNSVTKAFTVMVEIYVNDFFNVKGNIILNAKAISNVKEMLWMGELVTS